MMKNIIKYVILFCLAVSVPSLLAEDYDDLQVASDGLLVVAGQEIVDYNTEIPKEIVKLLNDDALRDEDGRIIVDGTPGYWNSKGDESQGTMTRSREAAFDGREDTFFDPPTKYNVAGEYWQGGCWAGISFDSRKVITRIRYKGRSDGANDTQLRQMTGCRFEGANSPDFSDAEVIAIANVDVDKTAEGGNTRWTGTNYWCVIDLPFVNSVTNTLANVIKTRKAYQYLRIIGPVPYVNSGKNQNGMCCGNVSELEFYGVDVSVPSKYPNYGEEMFTPVLSSRQVLGDLFTFDIGFPVPNNMMKKSKAAKSVGYFDDKENYLYGYELYKLVKGKDAQLITNELISTDFTVLLDDMIHQTFTVTEFESNIRYAVRGVNLVTNTPFLYIDSPLGKKAPFNVKVMPENINGDAKLTWNNADVDENYCAGITILRATAPGGPWTHIVDDLPFTDTTFTDTTLHEGIIYYYKLHYHFWDFDHSSEEATVCGEDSDVIEYRKIENIERDWNGDTSTLKEGMRAICHFKPWNAADSDWQTDFRGDGAPYNLFDNNPNTISDIQPKGNNKVRDDGTCKAGVDLGAQYIITHARILPRQGNLSAVEKLRFTQLALYASNADSTTETDGWRDDNNIVALTSRFQNPNPISSFYEVEISNKTPFRYVFVKHCNMTDEERTNNREAFANAAELQLYGYKVDEELASVLIAPLNLCYSREDEGNQVNISFSWKEAPNEEFYQIERSVDGKDGWEVVAISNTTNFNYSAPLDENCHNAYFRIASVRTISGTTEKEYAYSYTVRPSRKGHGTGLFASYTYPYESNIRYADEKLSRIDPTVDFNWEKNAIIPGYQDSTNDVGIVWNGKLIVPIEGEYTFKIKTDGGCALRIGTKQVIANWDGNNDNSNEEDASQGRIYLEEGEVDIRIDYFTEQRVTDHYNSFIHLYWSGPINEEIIPSSQLIPQKVTKMAYPWINDRTFYSWIKGYADYIPTVNLDGTISDGFYIQGGGGDIWLKEDTAHWVWRLVTGDFSISAKFERQVYATPNHKNDSGWAWKGCLISRKDLGYASPIVAAIYASNGKAGRADLKVRNEAGGDIFDHEARVLNLAPIIYQKLERKGRTFTQSFSEDGENWTVVKTYVDEQGLMDGVLYVGPGVSSIDLTDELGAYKVTVVKVKSDSGLGVVYVR